MDGIHLSVVVRQPLKEGGAIETLQVVLVSKLSEDALGIVRDVLWAGVERIGLRDLDGPVAPRPTDRATEDAAVKRLPMRQVVVTGKRATAQNGKGDANHVRLRPRGFLLVMDCQVVA